MTALLSADDVSKSYGDLVALDGVSLSVREGEVFALIGPNGAGKTTLVRALTGTVEPTAGTVTVFGESPADIDARRLGVLPQSFSPPDRLTARELLTYYAGLYDDPLDPEEVLATVGLRDAGDTWYENLSGGQQRRVCLGSALVNDPDLLFLDEPTTGIDPAGRRTVAERVETLAAGGTTVLLTTHDMAEAEALADRVGLLADGELVAVGTPDELLAEYGGESRLEIDLDAEAETVASMLAESGFDATTTHRGVAVHGIAPTEIGRVVDVLDAEGLSYTALTWREPTLEDVYMTLAGDEEGGIARDDVRSRGAPAVGGDV
ncbi:ABC transporter ATP-binding protein [Natranaeroarchaeum aerophilus]|uniref:ABC transporter ATP-binding protein n=1 Tax=Natranaeroarchaeum aerophilus TaxID=2917711 RepID=A0AAE3K4Q8_9EURY|nr:ABC transporter ATP-binding protein [Natranaeroarchaeum aerophilus]MCL9813448.1 ABC transporter ATP-binding protein [Natranaeroarchaeum aerophilus]